MNSMILFLLCGTSLVAPMSYGPAVAAPAPPTAAVRIDIKATEQLAAAIRQHMARELQAYPGVQVVDSQPQWTVKIVTQSLLDDEGNMMAVGLSVVVLRHGAQMNMLLTLARAWRYIINAGILQKDQPLEVGMRQLMAAIEQLPRTDELTTLSQHVMCVIPTEKLGQACRDIAADFNNRFLQPQVATPAGNAPAQARQP